MFFNLSKIGEFFITPAHVGLFLTAFGVALLFTRFARGGRTLATIGAVALLVMSFSPLGTFLALPLENRFPPPPEDLTAPDGIVVLGGAFDEYISMMRGRISFNEAAERLTAAVGLSRRFPRARLVFTGGTAALRGSPFSEAEVAGRFFRDMGVDSGRVVLEARSRNTWENAVFTRNFVVPRPTERWLLVTSAMHMPRVIGIFRQVGFPVIAYPVDYRTSGQWFEWTLHKNAPEMLRLVDLAAHEWFGLFVYRLTDGRSFPGTLIPALRFLATCGADVHLRLCTVINGQRVERLIPEPGDQTKARVPREQEEGGFKVGKILLLLLFMTSPVIAESTLREKMAHEPGQQGWFPGAGRLGNMQPITDSEIESFPAVDSTDECRDVKRPDGSPMYSKAGQLGNCIIEERNKASYSKAMWRNATSTTKKVCLAFARAKIAGYRGVFFYRLLSTCLGIRIPIDDQLQAEEE